MAYEQERNQHSPRRRRRNPRRHQKTMGNRRLFLLIGIAAAVLLAIIGLFVILLQPGPAEEPTTPSTTLSETAPTQPTEPQTVITLAFGGDINVTDKVVASGKQGAGYDYTNTFLDIAPVLAGADAAVVNLEGNLYGPPYGSQSSSAPKELVEALAACGVDFVQMANSCSINNGLTGLRQTLDGIRQAGMEPLGAYANTAEFEHNRGFTLRSINGVKVAFVAFTKGMDGLSLPQGGENCVNLLYKDYTSTYSEINEEGITDILRSVALEKPDVTIALLHWGSAYNGIVSESQKQIVKLMQEEGVDAIVGTHSHYVQDAEYDPEKNTFVAYSLGDLLGDGEKHNTNASAILQLEITKDNTTGKTTISGYDYTPVYICTEDTDNGPQLRLLRIREAMAAYDANSIHKVSDEIYAAMKTALSRIDARLKPKE